MPTFSDRPPGIGISLPSNKIAAKKTPIAKAIGANVQGAYLNNNFTGKLHTKLKILPTFIFQAFQFS